MRELFRLAAATSWSHRRSSRDRSSVHKMRKSRSFRGTSFVSAGIAGDSTDCSGTQCCRWWHSTESLDLDLLETASDALFPHRD